jgi:NTE family protein
VQLPSDSRPGVAAPFFRAGLPAGLVLGGGGARGLASIGITEVLESEGLRPAAIVGTSMGGLIGAFLAAGYTAADCHRLSGSLRWTRVLDLSTAGGLIKGERFGRWLARHLPARFSDLRIPLAVTATDIESGELVVLREGDLVTALRATTAFPGAFVPVQREGRILVDGGVLNTLPVDIIRDYDVSPIVAADFAAPRRRPLVPATNRSRARVWQMLTLRSRSLAADVLLKAVDVMQAEIAEQRLRRFAPDILIAPVMGGVHIEDFRSHEEIIAAGAREARRVLGELRRLGPDPRLAGPGGFAQA